MEEILASIRRIISEDGTRQNDGEAPGAPAVLAGAAADESKHEVLELRDMVQDDGSVRTLEAKAPAAPPPLPAAEPAPEPVVEAGAIDNGTALMSEATRIESARTLAELATAVAQEKASEGVDIPLGVADTTLRDLVSELLRPLLREWLDRNLPGLIERLVKREIEKLVRRAEGR